MTIDLASARTPAPMAAHVDVLKEYARRTMKSGEPLSQYEELEKAARLEELFDAGTRFGCTEKELVVLLFRGLFDRRRGCDCFTCKSRREARQPR